MKLLRGALAIILLLALLTWLLLRGIDTNAPAYAAALQAFDDFAIAEATLHRDVLQARAGLLRNYDTLVEAMERLQDAVARLRHHAQTEGLDEGSAGRLAATVARQEEVTERFKSSNALLQNSLSYVGLLGTTPAFRAHDAQLASAADALAAAVLLLTRDTSPNAVEALQERIDRISARAPAVGPDAEAARALLAHARLLQELLPAVDETLRALLAMPSRPPLDEIRAAFSEHRSAVEATAQSYRLLLYLTSLLLLVALVHLGLQLHGRAHALRRRAAFERVIAETSTRLINCPPAETELRLKQALGEFCSAIDADRAYVVLDENPMRVHAWTADGLTYPRGWPDQALTVSGRIAAARSDIVTVPDVAALPPGAEKDMLLAAGVRNWACVPLIRPGRVRGIMGFDAYRPARVGAFPLRLAGDVVANALEREFLERDRARLTTRRERSRRMQMIGSLASGIAHNFNNIISAILGYSEMIEPQLARGTKAAQHIDEIRRAAERGRDLIDNILTFGRQRDACVRPVQVRALFEEAAALLRASLPSGVVLVIEDVPADVAVSGEPAQLQQVILNLCTNAAQAMQHGGSIRITAEQKKVARRLPISHGELGPGRYVCLAFIDTGRGFDESVARRLFEPFFTTRLAGTGLGLATVHEIVRDHDGGMNVHSKPAQGSRFEVWLPAAEAGSTASADPATLPLGHGETVLVVESERERLLHDEEMLAALGYEPVGFERAADAIAACRSAPDRFDIILVSHAAQTSVELDFAHALHEAAPRKPVLLATASEIAVSVDALANAGISELLRRPLVSTDLAAALVRCLRSPPRCERNTIADG
jgi:signal transduction histidine kinase